MYVYNVALVVHIYNIYIYIYILYRFTASFSECAFSELRLPPAAPLVDETGKGINVVVFAKIDQLRSSLIRTITCMAFSAMGVRSMQQVSMQVFTERKFLQNYWGRHTVRGVSWSFPLCLTPSTLHPKPCTLDPECSCHSTLTNCVCKSARSRAAVGYRVQGFAGGYHYRVPGCASSTDY